MRKLALLFALVLLFAGCRVVIVDTEARIGVGAGGVILRFAPDRGPGASYRVGEEIRFVVTLRRPGYVSLKVEDPDGRTYYLEKDRWLPAGTSTLPPRWANYRYVADYPTGRHRATLYYTSERGYVEVSLLGQNGAATAGIRVREDIVTDWATTYLWVLP